MNNPHQYSHPTLPLLTFSPWRLFHVSGSPWTLPISSSCGRECWRPSAHSFWGPSWWCPCILISVFLAVSHLLPPCPALFWWYGIHHSVWHVHTSVVASASGVLLSAELLLLPWSLHFFCALSGSRLVSIATFSFQSYSSASHPSFSLSSIQPHMSIIVLSRSYNSLIDFMFELDGYFLVTDDSSYFSPFVPC